MTYLLALIGLIMLVTGGDWLVRGAVTVAEKLGVSSMLIGLTVVGFGTSLPELVTSIQAASQGADGMAIGNVMGSNIANILLILGVSALIYPFAIDQQGFRTNAAALSLSTVACLALCLVGSISRFSGVLLVVGLLGYLALSIRAERQRLNQSPKELATSTPILPIESPCALVVCEFPSGITRAIGLLIIGLALTLVGAHILISSAITLARVFEISEVTIGATVIAVGTSLPELVTCAVAAWKKQVDIAFGNIVGSNVFNVFGILGVTATTYPLALPAEVIGIESYFLAGGTIALLTMVVMGYQITRVMGLLLLMGYVGFIGSLIIRG